MRQSPLLVPKTWCRFCVVHDEDMRLLDGTSDRVRPAVKTRPNPLDEHAPLVQTRFKNEASVVLVYKALP